MDLEVVSTESWRVLSAETLRANLRRSASTEDALLETFIASATAYAEKRTKLSILGRKLRLFLPDWPSEYVELPAPPLRYVADADPVTAVTVQYRDADGVLTAMPADVLRLVKRPQVWALVPGDTLPPTLQDVPRAVWVTFDVGYASAAAVPADIADAIVLLASHRDVNREATLVDPRQSLTSKRVEYGVDELLRPHTIATRYTPIWA